MVDACAKAISHKGPVILIIRQCAYHGKGRSIISSGQMEYFDNKVFDKSIKCQGRQCIITTEGYYFPLDIISGLPYIKMMPNTDDEFKKLPHVILTDGQDWDPTCLDNVISDRDDWFDLVKLDEDDEGNILSDFKESNFDSKGMYKKRVQTPQNQPVDVETGDYKEPENNSDDNEGKNGSDLQINLHKLFQDASDLNQRYICTDTENSEIKCFNLESDDPADEDGVERIEATRDTIEIKEKKINYSHYRPHFLGASDEVLRMTFRNTTQYATNVVCDNRITQTINSPNPALNVLRRNEPVATDKIDAAVPAYDGGAKMAQIFVGRKSLFFQAYGMTSESQFVNALEDEIRRFGAMDVLISDGAQSETGTKAADIKRAYLIDEWVSEPYYQHQNFAEHRWGIAQKNLNWVMIWRKVDAKAWLLCLVWVGDMMNMTAVKSLGWRTPKQVLTGVTTDISIGTIFMFWDRVACARCKQAAGNSQPGDEATEEITGRFVGFAWTVGHALTFKVLTDDTKKVIERSRLRLIKCEENNLKLPKVHGEPQEVVVRIKEEEGKVYPLIDISKSPFAFEYEDGKVLKGKVKQEELASVEGEKGEKGESGETVEDKEKVGVKGKSTVEVETVDDDDDDEPVEPQEWIPKGEDRWTEERSKSNTAESLKEAGIDVEPPEEASSPSEKLRHPEKMGRKRAKRVGTRRYNLRDRQDVDYAVKKADVKEGEKLPYSAMDDPPLKDQPLVSEVEKEEDMPPHQRSTHKPGREKIIDEAPLDLSTDPMDAPNPTVRDLDPEQLPGRTFLMPEEQDGTRHRAKILEMIEDYKNGRNEDKTYIKFKCLINSENKAKEEIVAYNDIVDYIEIDHTWDGLWKFEEILDHEGPLAPNHPRYMGCKWNLLMRWGTGEQTWRPLIGKDAEGRGCGVYNTDPITCAIYAYKNNLWEKPGWRHRLITKHCKNLKMMERNARQAKLHSFRHKPIFMYGFQVPRNHRQAMELDRENGNTRWWESEQVELAQIDEYKTFLDKGKGYKPGPDYKKITVHMVCAVKHDGRHKARFVAGGHLTETPIDSVCSSVVSLRGVRTLLFIAEHNECEAWVTDIGNAYLETYTQEKVYIIAGEEFGDRAGHTLIIMKALYGLKSSGLRWHERLADVLRDMGFFPSRAEADIWMRPAGDHYEYIGVYVDDLLIISKNPKAISDALMDKYKFKLKGTGPITFHLGCDFVRDDDGKLCYQPKKYIEKMVDNYERIFGEKPRKYKSPLEKGDHPELDMSPLLKGDEVKIYQSLIGALQWVIQIGRWDITTAVMTMSRFRALPRQGHLDRVKRIHGYLFLYKGGMNKIDTTMPDFSHIPEKVYDWEQTCYRGATEDIDPDAPPPLGKPIMTTTYVDANLYHDLISGKAVSGIMHFLNNTVIDTSSRLQSTVETATFGSEYCVSKTGTDQIIDLRITLRYLGAPVKGSSFMFGDNETVVNTASVPHGKLHKRHNALSCHRTRWAIAAGILKFYHIAGNTNPADILSKHWDHPSIWPSLQPLMFWKGVKSDGAKVDVHPKPQFHSIIEGSERRAISVVLKGCFGACLRPTVWFVVRIGVLKWHGALGTICTKWD